jgi:type I restriction enzyme S subunit
MNKLVPDDWSRAKLGELIGVQGGNAFKSECFCDNGIPIIRISNIKKDGSVNLKGAVYFAEDSNLIRFKAIKGDVLIAMSGATTGKVGRYNSDGFAYINQRVGRFFLKDDNGCCIDFIHQITSEDEFTNSILIDAVGGAQPNISNQQIESISINLPPLPEQQKIAQILTSVDEVIEKTQAQIDKLKDLKTAMMQELLTKGIGHFEFKDSPVGRIPVGWDAELLDTMAKRGSGHTPNKLKPEYWNGHVKWISLTDSNKLDKLYIHDTVKKISQLGIENSSATPHPVGTVVMARDAGIGKSAITTSEMAVSQHFMAWVCGDKLDNYFLYYLLQYWKPRFENIAMGSTIKTIGLPYFKKLLIPVPTLSEQLKISQALRSVDGKIFSLEKKNKTIKNTKKALMQDLLTGKVRVTVNNN